VGTNITLVRVWAARSFSAYWSTSLNSRIANGTQKQTGEALEHAFRSAPNHQKVQGSIPNRQTGIEQALVDLAKRSNHARGGGLGLVVLEVGGQVLDVEIRDQEAGFHGIAHPGDVYPFRQKRPLRTLLNR